MLKCVFCLPLPPPACFRAVKALVSLTASSSDPELVQVCARVLRNVSFSSACRAKLADCGGSTTAIRYSTFSSSNEVCVITSVTTLTHAEPCISCAWPCQVRDDCIVTLCNLVKDDTLLESVVRDGAVKALNTATKSASVRIDRVCDWKSRPRP